MLLSSSQAVPVLLSSPVKLFYATVKNVGTKRHKGYVPAKILQKTMKCPFQFKNSPLLLKEESIPLCLKYFLRLCCRVCAVATLQHKLFMVFVTLLFQYFHLFLINSVNFEILSFLSSQAKNKCKFQWSISMFLSLSYFSKLV